MILVKDIEALNKALEEAVISGNAVKLAKEKGMAHLDYKIDTRS